MTTITKRLTKLEQTHRPEVPEIQRIIISPKGGDPLDGAVMERQPDGTWRHRPITESEAENHDARGGPAL